MKNPVPVKTIFRIKKKYGSLCLYFPFLKLYLNVNMKNCLEQRIYIHFKYVSFSPIKKVSQWEKPLWDPSTEEKNKIRREYLKQKYNMKI